MCRSTARAVHLRHVEVEQDELGPLVLEELHRLCTARHTNRLLAEATQDAVGEDAGVLIVVDNQYQSRQCLHLRY